MNRQNPIVILVLVLVFVLVLPVGRACGGEPVVFQLKPEAKVDGAGVFLDQLVSRSSHATLPLLRLAQAPVLGQTMSLSRQQVIDLAKESFPELNTTNWAGPAAIQISRSVRQLCEAEMLEMLRAALQKDYVGGRGTLELGFMRPWTPIDVPEGKVSLQLSQVPSAGILPNLMISFEIWSGKERVCSVQAPLHANIWHEIPVAHSPVLRGQLLCDADITMERRDVLTQHEACIPFPVTDHTLEAVTSIQAGAPMCSRLVRNRPVLKRGQLVEAVFTDGPMTISLKVETLEEGALGQTVRVRNPKTRRELYGKIQTQDLVLITL